MPQHVLRFWESKFTQVRPLKRGGGRRYYRPEDVGLLKRIRSLLYTDGMTIKGAQKLLRESGPKVEPRADEPAEQPVAHPRPSGFVREDAVALLGELAAMRAASPRVCRGTDVGVPSRPTSEEQGATPSAT